MLLSSVSFHPLITAVTVSPCTCWYLHTQFSVHSSNTTLKYHLNGQHVLAEASTLGFSLWFMMSDHHHHADCWHSDHVQLLKHIVLVSLSAQPSLKQKSVGQMTFIYFTCFWETRFSCRLWTSLRVCLSPDPARPGCTACAPEILTESVHTLELGKHTLWPINHRKTNRKKNQPKTIAAASAFMANSLFLRPSASSVTHSLIPCSVPSPRWSINWKLKLLFKLFQPASTDLISSLIALPGKRSLPQWWH